VHLLGGNITVFLNSIVRFGGESMLIQNLRRFLESEPVCPDGEKMPESMQSIEFKQVSFTYPSAEKTVLENINLTIRKGEKISIVGLNGAGKTTLVKLLLGLYNPTAGNIYYNGVDVHEYDKNSYQRCFATVFQDFQLFALPVKTNVKMDCVTESDFIKIDEALETAKFFENNHATTESVLTKEYGEDGIVLSGGQAQKLAIARAFYHEGEIIVLDEPSSALDPIAENEAYMNMLHAAKNRTVIIISHRLSTAAMADRIILIDGKHIKESGNHEELMNIKGLYYDMFTKQAEKYKIKGEI
jgi:ATP-binding cassette subfamily B protein